METINYEEFAEQFALGMLNGYEKQWFEKELDMNPALWKKVRFYQDLGAAISGEGESEVLEFRTIVKNAGAAYKLANDRQKVRKLMLRVSITAAGFLLLVASAFIYLSLGHRQNSPEKIFAGYYMPYQTAMTFRSGNAVPDQLYARAMKLYEEGRYQEAMIALDSVLTANPNNSSALFYAGMTQMGLKDYSSAENYFRKVMEIDNSLYLQQAEWYRGLCLIVLNDKKSAIMHFTNLASGNGYYSAKASLVLRELN